MCIIRGPYSRIPISGSICRLPGQLVASRAEHTRRAPAGPDFVCYIRDIYVYFIYTYFTYYALWNAKHRSGHLIRLMLTNWRWRHDAISSIRQIQGAWQRDRESINWNCENQKFHSFSYKSVNVCHLSKRTLRSLSPCPLLYSCSLLPTQLDQTFNFSFDLHTNYRQALRNIFWFCLCFGFLF